MEGIITDFDREVYRKKAGLFKDRLKEGGHWNYEVENGDKFSFVLKDGTQLDVLEYRLDKEDRRYDQFKFLLAEIGGVAVGFLNFGIISPNEKTVVGKSASNIGVLIKSKGIGGRLNAVRDYLLQKEANKIGTIIVIGDDENETTIGNEFRTISDEFNYNSFAQRFKRRLSELIVNRQNWLALYGPEGRSGYKYLRGAGRGKFFRRFRKGDPLPKLNCTMEKNDTSLKYEVEKIRW